MGMAVAKAHKLPPLAFINLNTGWKWEIAAQGGTGVSWHVGYQGQLKFNEFGQPEPRFYWKEATEFKPQVRSKGVTG